MKQESRPIVSAILFSVALVAVSVFVVQASSALDIVYPVTELGGCRNEVECRAFCDKPENRIGVCWDFAIQHNLVSDEEIEGAKQFTKSAVSGGTGWCKSTEECYKYCADVHNLNTCLDFVEKNNLIDDPQELDEARRVAAYLNQGGKMPGDCRGKDACFAYCSNAENTAECFNFAKEAGFLNEQDQAEFSTFMGLLAKGETPGGCRSKDECESFCAVEANFDACIAFAEKAGFISKDEVAIARKVGSQGGPGGCKSKKACEAYCNNPENLEACFAFAKEHDLLDEDQMETIQKGTEQIRAALRETPPEVLECLKATVGENIIQEINAGTLIPGPEIGLRMKSCFEAQGAAAFKKALDTAPPEIVSCLGDTLGQEKIDQIRSGRLELGSDAFEFNDKVRGCVEPYFSDVEEQLHECVAKPCEEALACMQGLQVGVRPGSGGGDLSGLDLSPDIKGRLESCVVEQRTKSESQMNECVAKSCEEMLACFQALPKPEGGESQGEEHGLNPDIQAKLDACIAQQQQGEEGQQDQFPQGERSAPPSEEQIRQQYEQQYQQQQEQQYQEQYQQYKQEQPSPPSSEQYQEQYQQQYQQQQEQQYQEQYQQSLPPSGTL
ncbi:MAG: hypothetical protein HY458_00605 [Parcubacteria group bacterium]|nr:hypothetical protein [Parcubacteria group bacterium]